MSGKSLKEVNWAKVGVSALSGGVSAAVPGGFITAAVIGGTTDVAFDMIDGNINSVGDAAKSFAWGAAKEVVSQGVGKALDKGIGKLAGKFAGKSGSFSKGVGNPVEVVGRGSTGRTVPNTLNEQMAMHQVMSNPLEGAVDMSQLKNHPVIMSDSRWLASEGWVKMSNNVNGVEIHFVYNKITGAFDDFKFK